MRRRALSSLLVSADAGGLFLFDYVRGRLALGGQRISDEVFVYVAHILNGLASDNLRGRVFNVAEPNILIEALLFRDLAKFS